MRSCDSDCLLHITCHSNKLYRIIKINLQKKKNMIHNFELHVSKLINCYLPEQLSLTIFSYLTQVSVTQFSDSLSHWVVLLKRYSDLAQFLNFFQLCPKYHLMPIFFFFFPSTTFQFCTGIISPSLVSFISMKD